MVIVTEIKRNSEEDISMSNSNDFLDTIHEKQAKDEQNRKRQGNGNPGKKKPNKTHK
jgi:hypothetical protein